MQHDIGKPEMELLDKLAERMAARLPPDIDRDMLAGAGAIGLLDAAERYDPGRGASFATFAARRIQGEMAHEARLWSGGGKRRAHHVRTLSMDSGEECRIGSFAAAPGDSPDARIVEDEEIRDLLRPLDQYPKLRFAVRLAIDGLNGDEIARTMGYHASYISQMLDKARRILVSAKKLPKGVV